MAETRLSKAQASDTQPGIDIELDQFGDADNSYAPVQVEVVSDGNVPEHKVQEGRYQTVLIPASTSTVVSWAQILPRDPIRGYAYIMPVDYPIVISTELPEVQNSSNIGAAFPNGGYIGSGFSPAIRHKEAVYAANTSTAGSCRVVVMIDRGQS